MKAPKKEAKKTKRILGVKKDALLTMRHDDFGAILENISEKFDVLIEGQNIHSEKIDRLEVRMDRIEIRMDSLETRFDGLETRFDGLETRMDGQGTRMDSLEITMRSNFQTVFEYLSRIDEEIHTIRKDLERLAATKADKTEIHDLTRRVSQIEKEIAEMKRTVKI